MSLEERLMAGMITAMKSGDRARVTAIRMFRAPLQNLAIDKKRELTDQDVIQVLAAAAKKKICRG